jgi:parallel beta-helix repeat protein
MKRIVWLGAAVAVALAAGCVGLRPAEQTTAGGRTFVVDGAAANAADTNAGTASQPWKTIARAGGATELKPGDTVLIKSGVYREHARIAVSGAPGRPITFAAAPGAKVVIKGSEIVQGPWTRLADAREVNVAPNVPRASVWRIKLGEEFFTDKDFPNSYTDTSKRWVSQVFWQDTHPLQMIGPDGVYKNDDSEHLIRMRSIGKGLDDMIPQSFFFDPASGYLYIYIGGDPGWYVIEVGVRGFLLTCTRVHDVVVRGLELRHNRQPGGQWAAVGIGQCERVVMEDCRVEWADFSGLGLGTSTNCTLRRCDFSNNGCTGMGLGLTEDCVVEDCSLMRNDTRKFYGTWGVAAGSKNIPGNRRTTFRRCEFAYNDGPGLWFDTDNADIRILDNIIHHNTDCGIFFEINRKGGGVIAGNLVYANGGRGIYVGGSENTIVAHNTVVDNDCGIVFMPYNDPNGTTAGSVCLNNLLIHNYVAGATVTRGCDLTLEMQPGPAWQASHRSRSDGNVYADNAWTPTMRPNWNDDHSLARWQQLFGLDVQSRQARVDYRRIADGFELLNVDGLPPAGPLPEVVTRIWKPRNPARVGADLTAWPPCPAKGP